MTRSLGNHEPPSCVEQRTPRPRHGTETETAIDASMCPVAAKAIAIAAITKNVGITRSAKVHSFAIYLRRRSTRRRRVRSQPNTNTKMPFELNYGRPHTATTTTSPPSAKKMPTAVPCLVFIRFCLGASCSLTS